ncbi:MAG TPA: hypothetical protein VN306_11970 [Mycobacterium sp.]|nr:hypothetical protein [Mycobacterium sp.]
MAAKAATVLESHGTLAARAYERYAEHAVAVAHRAALLAVGTPGN